MNPDHDITRDEDAVHPESFDEDAWADDFEGSLAGWSGDMPAFPRVAHEDPNGGKPIAEQDGMSLRDYFAGQALPAVIAMIDARSRAAGDKDNGLAVLAARVAYSIADAVVREGDQ